MAKYRYAGPGPIEALSGGEVIRPGDEREFDEEPVWGPWDLIEEPETDEGDQPGPPEASPAAVSAAPALNITPAPAATPEGKM